MRPLLLLAALGLPLLVKPSVPAAAPERPPGAAVPAPGGAPAARVERSRRTAALERAEPTVSEVLELALRASGLSAGRDRQWSRRARLSALLPQLTVRATRDVARDKARSRASNGTERLDVDYDRDAGIEARAVWNLDRLVFDSVELSAARAALAEGRERSTLAAHVTSLYYQRRRAQLALIWQPPSTELERIERQLAIQEHTAALDAVTGGGFSRLLRARRRRAP